MTDPSKIFLLANLALSFYLVGAIWSIEVDIFRSWKLVDARDFPKVQGGPLAQAALLDFHAARARAYWVDRSYLVSPNRHARLGNLGKSRLPNLIPGADGHILG